MIDAVINRRFDNRSLSDSETWATSFIGFRGKFFFNEDLYALGRADYGGFDNHAYNIYAALGVRVKESIVAELGFRRIGVDFTDGGFFYNASFTGPFVRAIIQF